MKLFYHDESKKLSYEEVVEGCKKGYGVEHPERISGFNGFFYRLDDIYLYGRLEKWVEDNPKLETDLNGFIRRFMQEDYGLVTRDESNNNGENRWLCGSCWWAIGRYCFEDKQVADHYGGIVLEFLPGCGFLYSIEEDMTEIYEKYAGGNHAVDLVYRGRK